MSKTRKRPGKRYTPALDQVPVSGLDRYIRQLQNLLLLCPDSKPTREQYYAALRKRGVPQEATGAPPILVNVIKSALNPVRLEPVHPALRRTFKARLAALLRRFVAYLEKP
jgi:hypothetical protein